MITHDNPMDLGAHMSMGVSLEWVITKAEGFNTKMLQ